MHNFRWWFLPYCLQRLENGKYVVLNRAYKPVGMVTEEWVDYEPHGVKIKIGKNQARALSYNKSEEKERVYLYDDATNPNRSKATMDEYLRKVGLLAAYTIDEEI
jgi:hypothetical protein